MLEVDRNEILKEIVTGIKEILSSDLGVYQQLGSNNVVLGEIPAVWVMPPELPVSYRFKEKSGIEAIISRDTEVSLSDGLLGANAPHEKFKILLRQFNLNKSISSARDKILHSKKWLILDDPILLPYAETSYGNAYPQCIINISVKYRQKFL